MEEPSRLPWWHRRVVLVTDDEAWASHAGGTIRALGGWPEILTWSSAATLAGPVGALVVDVEAARTDVETALVGWAAAGRQPTTLLWVPPHRGAAHIGHTLDRLRYPVVFDCASTDGMEKDLKRHLPRILFRGGWIVTWYGAALGWSAEPLLVHILSLPVLAQRRPKSVEEWRRAVGKLSHAEFVELCREHGAPNPKKLYDHLTFSEATVWAAERRFSPTRTELARHLHYSSGWYTMQRAHQLAGLTYEDLVERPVVDLLASLTRPLLRVGCMPPGHFKEGGHDKSARSS